jgi:superfamily II DNA/RNA helicase
MAPIDTEIKNLSNPPAVLIGTPGRIADHIDRGTFRIDKIQTLILDEFDKSLQLGFHEQMSFIINQIE